MLAAIELGLSNGRLEGLNSKVRLLSHRAYGFASPDALIATIYLCCAGAPASQSRCPTDELHPQTETRTRHDG